jgi:hypothetical protein
MAYTQATRERRSGGWDGAAHRRSHFYGGACVNREEVPVWGRWSGQGGAPWQCGTRCGVREQPEVAVAGGELVEEDDDGGTHVGRLR